ncbi:MAG: DUF6597 domain-containing transcriptional factor [Caldilineaceae bacterium]
MWNTYGTVAWPSHTQLMGIHFRPGGAYPFLNFPLSVLQNQIVAAELLWGNFAVELCARLHAAPSIQARVLLFEELLRTRLHDAPYGLDID